MGNTLLGRPYIFYFYDEEETSQHKQLKAKLLDIAIRDPYYDNFHLAEVDCSEGEDVCLDFYVKDRKGLYIGLMYFGMWRKTLPIVPQDLLEDSTMLQDRINLLINGKVQILNDSNFASKVENNGTGDSFVIFTQPYGMCKHCKDTYNLMFSLANRGFEIQDKTGNFSVGRVNCDWEGRLEYDTKEICSKYVNTTQHLFPVIYYSSNNGSMDLYDSYRKVEVMAEYVERMRDPEAYEAKLLANGMTLEDKQQEDVIAEMTDKFLNEAQVNIATG
eukprot:TRINITY_DN19743_c0_g1_i1.p1 TRINITY_DN19743_c0_g1~~TRINITY_DN19743_c0_g1_i1.p1  ORF type:complete len:321 (-),score=63.75 TRINITY_DN19743_c0_g1_i1:64-885(-)